MAKKDMKHPDVTRGPGNDVSPVPQIQGKAKSGNPVICVGGSFTVLHAACIGEAVQLLREKLDQKNVYFMNPALDM